MSQSMQASAFDDLSLATNNLSTAIGNFASAAVEFVKALANAVPFVIEAIKSGEEGIAYTWAENTHPEWMKIHRRTKKKRIRKKYHDRIMRAFREAVSNGG